MPSIIISGEIPDLPPFASYQVYNILDSAVTAQLFHAIKPHLNSNHLTVYEREKRVQALCLEMSTKGFPVDQFSLAELLWQLEKEEQKCEEALSAFCLAIDHLPINPRSPMQIAELFYDYLGLPTIYEYDRQTRKRKVSTDIKALEKLRENYPIAAPFVNAIEGAKAARKLASVFKRGLEPGSGHLRCNFSPTGTETGRLSSQQNPYGRGTNAQNLTNNARQVICAPQGFAVVNIDLKTAESIAVGFISGETNYINACLSGDLHTNVARRNWKNLGWTGDLKTDRALAEQPYYRQFSYRDMAKRGGHATNYYVTDRTMAAHLKVTVAVTRAFQEGYFKEFPGIAEWQLETIARVQTDGYLITPLHRERTFWGRPDDPATHREAIAYCPQSLVADVWDEGLVQLQRWIMANAKSDIIDLRAQVHDSGVFLVPIDMLDEVIPLMQKALEYPVDFGELGTMLIPTDVEVGRRWCKVPKQNPNRFLIEGMKSWSPGQALHWEA